MIYNDGVDTVIASNSEGASEKGKIYFGEDKTSYYDESTGDIYVNGSLVAGGASNYALAVTSNNIAYTLAVAITALTNGAVVTFKMPNAVSAGAVTLNVNSLGAKKVMLSGQMATQANSGDLEANGEYIAIYNTSADTTGAWMVYGAALVQTRGNQTIAGIKTFTGANIHDPFNYAILATSNNIAYTSAVALTALANGDLLFFKMPASASAGAVTINVNSLGAKKAFLSGQVATQANSGDLEADAAYVGVYDTSLDAAAGGWVIYGAAVVQTRGNQTIAGNKTFTGTTIINSLNHAVAATSDNIAYTLAVAISALTTGTAVIFKMPAANCDSAATLNVNSLGAKTMIHAGTAGTSMLANDLLADQVYLAIYDATLDSENGAWVVSNAIQSPTTGWVGGANATTVRTFDCNNTSIDELADVLATLIADLKARYIPLISEA